MKLCAGESTYEKDVVRNSQTMAKMNAPKIPNMQTVSRTIQLMLQYVQYGKKLKYIMKLKPTHNFSFTEARKIIEAQSETPLWMIETPKIIDLTRQPKTETNPVIYHSEIFNIKIESSIHLQRCIKK